MISFSIFMAFENHEHIAGLDGLPLRNIDAQDVAGHRSGDNFAGSGDSRERPERQRCRAQRGSGRAAAAAGGQRRAPGIRFVLIHQHGLASLYLDLIGLAVQGNLYFILLYLLDGFEAQFIQGLAELIGNDRHQHRGFLVSHVKQLHSPAVPARQRPEQAWARAGAGAAAATGAAALLFSWRP